MQPDGTSTRDAPPPWADFSPLSSKAWIEHIRQDLHGAEIEKLVWRTLDGLAIQPFYGADDSLQREPLLHRLPGNDWLIRQDIRIHGVDTTKHLIRESLHGGANSLGLLFGRHPVETGLLRSLLKDIPLDTVAIHLESQVAPRQLLADLLQWTEEHGVPPDQLHGTLVCNPFKGLIEQGHSNILTQLNETASILVALDDNSTLRVLSVDARVFHNAGATPAQELGCTLAAASEYLVQMTEQDVPVAAIVPRMRFEMPVWTSFFPEMAKLRALCLLFPQLIRAFDDTITPAPPYIRAETSQWSLTLYDPHVNLLRSTTEATAAILGGCDELSILPYDAATGTSSDHARRLALNIQHILRYEAHLDIVADPAAGSYHLESLTNEFADAAWSFFQQIEAKGGLVSAMQKGFIQQAIKASRDERLKLVDEGRTPLVGTNTFPQAGENRLPKTRDEIKTAALPVTPAIEPLPSIRAATHFEALRLRTERHARATGKSPSVLPLMLGDPMKANARASFTRNFFGTAGFEVLPEQLHQTPEQAASAALEEQPDIVALCSADATYSTIAGPISHLLRQSSHPPLIAVAGYPEEYLDTLISAGVDAFFHRKTPLLAALTDFQDRLGLSE